MGKHESQSESPYFVVLAQLDGLGCLTDNPEKAIESMWEVWDGFFDRQSSWETLEEAIAERDRLAKNARGEG